MFFKYSCVKLLLCPSDKGLRVGFTWGPLSVRIVSWSVGPVCKRVAAYTVHWTPEMDSNPKHRWHLSHDTWALLEDSLTKFHASRSRFQNTPLFFPPSQPEAKILPSPSSRRRPQRDGSALRVPLEPARSGAGRRRWRRAFAPAAEPRHRRGPPRRRPRGVRQRYKPLHPPLLSITLAFSVLLGAWRNRALGGVRGAAAVSDLPRIRGYKP